MGRTESELRTRIRNPHTSGITVPAKATQTTESEGIALPEEAPLLDVIKAMPIDRLIQVNACFWGKIAMDENGVEKMLPSKGQFTIFGQMKNGAVFDLTVGQNSNGDYDNNLPADMIQGIMKGLGLKVDPAATQYRNGRASGEYIVVHYV